MLSDLLLACLHHLMVFSLVAVAAAEFAVLRGPMGALRIRDAARLDAVYGLLALLILAVGFGRVFHGAKSPDFYLHNPVFWGKLVFFAAVGVVSIVPTVRLLRWKKAAARDAAFVVADAEVANTRRWLSIELALFVPIPLLAAAMARGVGLG